MRSEIGVTVHTYVNFEEKWRESSELSLSHNGRNVRGSDSGELLIKNLFENLLICFYRRLVYIHAFGVCYILVFIMNEILFDSY